MKALDALTEGLFDYAGLFPPAQLPFGEMLAEAATLDSLHRPELVGNELVLTLEHLDQMDDDALQAAGIRRPMRACLVGVPVEEAGEAGRRISEMSAAYIGHGLRFTSLEVYIDGRPDAHHIAAHVTQASHHVKDLGVQIYLEARWPAEERADFADDYWAAVDQINNDADLEPVGAKVRCAGPYALSPERLVLPLRAANKRHIPVKATQGLHHAVVTPGTTDNTVGFIGLAAALRLHRALGDGLTEEEMVACITEQDATAFGLEDGLSWKDHAIDLGALGQAIEATPFAIGSCSLAEPDAELKALFG